MNLEKLRFSIGSAHSGTCAISKRWGVSIWPITRPRSQNWRQSSVVKSTNQRIGEPANRRKGVPDENTCAEDRCSNYAGSAAVRVRLLHKEKRQRKTGQCRLLDLHDAPISAREGARKVSDLFDGSCPGDESQRDAGKLQQTAAQTRSRGDVSG